MTGAKIVWIPHRNGKPLDGKDGREYVEILDFNPHTGLGLANFRGCLVSFAGSLLDRDEYQRAAAAAASCPLEFDVQ